MKSLPIDSPSAYMEMFALLAKSDASFHEKPRSLADDIQLDEFIKPVGPMDPNCFEAHLFSLLALD